MNRYGLFINGAYRHPSSGDYDGVVSPINLQVFAEVAIADENDAKMAIESAKQSFHSGKWRRMAPRERGRLLISLGKLLRERSFDYARMETIQTGKPIREALQDVMDAAKCFEFYGELADKTFGEVPAIEDQDTLALVFREPLGVIGIIVPWNFPLLLSSWKLAPSLACGNTCVLKPSELAPVTPLMLGELFKEAGFPEGVVNIISGYGDIAGAEIARSHDVDMVSFTGSTETGREIMRLASSSVKKLSLELGGKSPLLVFDDSVLDFAVEQSVYGAFLNQGQVCSATSRVLVQNSIYDEFIELVVERAKCLHVGNPLEESTDVGPLISRKQLGRVEDYVKSGLAEGAELVFGGSRVERDDLKSPYYYSPTVFARVDSSFKIAREEIFGPVLAVIPFPDEDEALRIANDTSYGLAAGIITSDLSRALRLVGELRCGVVWVNSSQPCHVELPWGGCKLSGFGRDLGRQAMDAFSLQKQVSINLGAPRGR